MGRLFLGLLVVVMLSLTSYIAYTSFGQSECCDSVQPAATASTGCCSQATETATAETPACCKDKATCCETQGEKGACCQQNGEKKEAGSCCQTPTKAEAIAGDKKPEKKD
jgi:hypothetical protein